MSFQPTVPVGGLLGLRLIDKTYDRQFAAFSRDTEIERDIAAFRSRAEGLATPADLVADTQVLRVALGAFGLEDELLKRAFIRRVLEEGTLDPRSLANRLADRAWREFAGAIGYGDLGSRLDTAVARERLIEAYRVRQFERAVGESDVNLRLALNFRREIREIATDPQVGRTGWYRILGSDPLRKVVVTALGLPESFGQIDIDQQRERLEERSSSVLGASSPAAFSDPEVVEDTVRRFLLQAGPAAGAQGSVPGATALAVLERAGLGLAAQTSLFVSRF